MIRISLLVISFLIAIPTHAGGGNIKMRHDTTATQSGRSLIGRIINYFETSNKDSLSRHPKFSFIGGPHYSSDTKFGIGLLAAGLYSTKPENDSLKPSNVTLFADVTTGNYYKVGIEGLHLYKNNTHRINYEASFKSYSTYYWGIGVDNGLSDTNKTRYRLLNIDLTANHLWKLWKNFYLGPSVEFTYTSARNRSNPARWRDQPQKTYILKIGGVLQFDSRDNYSSPSYGWLGEASTGFHNGVSHSYKDYFFSFGFNICYYTTLWKSGVIASRVHGDLTFGDTPWTQMPTLGSDGTMRGYYEGQYRDKNEMDLTVELRQHILKRSGIVVFGGMGAIFPSFRHLGKRHILPSYGFGYRWEFKRKTNVRVDFGFGKKCWGVDFNIGEAF